jgi:8-oxo-dGTP pyrophosphatase MutT (NUDIX family)
MISASMLSLHTNEAPMHTQPRELPPISAQIAKALELRRPRYELNLPRRASVLIGLVEDGGPPRLLLTRRASTLGNHSGEVAYPGGMMDPSDKSVAHTALREAHEEVRLPAERVELLGPLDDMIPKNRAVAVTPWVGLIRSVPPLVANSAEVARIFYIPLSALQEPKRWQTKDVSWDGRSWPIHFFDYDGERLWGLSAFFTLALLGLTEEGAPIKPNWSEIHKTLNTHIQGASHEAP